MLGSIGLTHLNNNKKKKSEHIVYKPRDSIDENT